MAESGEDDFRSVLASVDRRGRRRWIYAAIVAGPWRRRRTLLSVLLIAIYLGLPFATVGGEPMLRFDLVAQRYTIAGRTFWPQDFFFLLLAVLAVVIATLCLVSVFGRVFCGWLCPHQVFLEQVFRRIEAWCEGPAHRRRLADLARPHPANWWLRKALKWFLFIIIAGAMANTATALFIGTADFRWGFLVDATRHPTGAIFFAVFFALNLFNFAWFREQTCTIVCPYGRWQSALLDRETLGVAYDPQRGEPRGKKGRATGDCVDCHQCVAVCPTGIDIRHGNQMECIHCTACIDACDAVMIRLDRPRGLIRYASEASLVGEKPRLVRPRAAIYALALLLVFILGFVQLATRTDVLATRLRDTGVPMLETGGDGQPAVRGLVNLALVNRARTDRLVRWQLPANLDAEIFAQFSELILHPDESRELALIIRIPRRHFPTGATFARKRLGTVLTVSDDHGEITEIPLMLEAP